MRMKSVAFEYLVTLEGTRERVEDAGNAASGLGEMEPPPEFNAGPLNRSIERFIKAQEELQEELTSAFEEVEELQRGEDRSAPSGSARLRDLRRRLALLREKRGAKKDLSPDVAAEILSRLSDQESGVSEGFRACEVIADRSDLDEVEGGAELVAAAEQGRDALAAVDVKLLRVDAELENIR